MSYPSGGDRRKADRRVFNDPNYVGPERRIVVRRQPEREPRSKLGLIAAAIAVLFIADATLWKGQYRNAALSTLHAETGDIREWSAHVWDMG